MATLATTPVCQPIRDVRRTLMPDTASLTDKFVGSKCGRSEMPHIGSDWNNPMMQASTQGIQETVVMTLGNAVHEIMNAEREKDTPATAPPVLVPPMRRTRRKTPRPAQNR